MTDTFCVGKKTVWRIRSKKPDAWILVSVINDALKQLGEKIVIEIVEHDPDEISLIVVSGFDEI